MQSLLPVLDSSRTLAAPYVRPYPYPPYAGVGYGYVGSPLPSAVPFPFRPAAFHDHAPKSAACPAFVSGDEVMLNAAATLKVFRPVNFERPGGCYLREAPPQPPPPVPASSEQQTGRLGEHHPAAEKAHVTLLERELWESFHAVGNEMIVTKPGRRLFPPLCVTVIGLNPRARYEVSLRLVPADNYRYKFINATWIPVAESDVLQKEAKHIYTHPDSTDPEASTGESWMKKQVNFKNVKISHNPTSPHGDLLVHTMHKYIIEIVVKPENFPTNTTCVRFPETTFIAVTSYQNNALTQMKIENNPFAKGFRERDSNSSSGGSVYSSPQSSPQSYFPLQMPLRTPLWIMPPGEEGGGGGGGGGVGTLEMSSEGLLGRPTLMEPLPLQPCCWAWPPPFFAAKQEKDAAGSFTC